MQRLGIDREAAQKTKQGPAHVAAQDEKQRVAKEHAEQRKSQNLRDA